MTKNARSADSSKYYCYGYERFNDLFNTHPPVRHFQLKKTASAALIACGKGTAHGKAYYLICTEIFKT